MFDSNSNTHIDKKNSSYYSEPLLKLRQMTSIYFMVGLEKKFQTPFDLFHFHVIYTPLSYIHFTGRKNVEIFKKKPIYIIY